MFLAAESMSSPKLSKRTSSADFFGIDLDVAMRGPSLCGVLALCLAIQFTLLAKLVGTKITAITGVTIFDEQGIGYSPGSYDSDRCLSQKAAYGKVTLAVAQVSALKKRARTWGTFA
jgi:hypothetical protein